MTNKSIRDYINLIENAQREGSATRTCPECDGSGEDTLDNHKPCRRCNGKGHIPQKSGVAEGTVYPNAEVIKSKNGKPVGEIYQDGNTWGCFHYRADRGADFLDSREDAIQELKLIHQENGRKTPDYTIKGEVEEGQLDETSPEAIAKIEQLTRR
jgi:hypothetical protein